MAEYGGGRNGRFSHQLESQLDGLEDEQDLVQLVGDALFGDNMNAFLVASYSKSHMKVKGDKSERPRFHVFFPIEQVSSETEYGALKHMVAESFPYFDDNALDSARFLYGGVTDVEVYEGDKTVVDFLEADDFADFDAGLEEIPQGPKIKLPSCSGRRH